MKAGVKKFEEYFKKTIHQLIWSRHSFTLFFCACVGGAGFVSEEAMYVIKL